MNEIIFPKLIFPEIPLQICKDKENYFCFDIFRRKKVVLTKEEWVRQHVAYFLVQKNYAKSRMVLEKSFALGEKKFRADIVVYNRDLQPELLVECKSADIFLTEKSLDQLIHYNFSLRVPLLMLTNGLEVLYYGFEKKELKILKHLD